MSEAANKLVEVGVVLQGGGALGAYECGALNALLELIEVFSEQGHQIQLKVVSGVSIGSINAACVVGAKSSADARARLNALWDDLMLEAPPFWMQAAQRDLAYFGLPRRIGARQPERGGVALCRLHPERGRLQHQIVPQRVEPSAGVGTALRADHAGGVDRPDRHAADDLELDLVALLRKPLDQLEQRVQCAAFVGSECASALQNHADFDQLVRRLGHVAARIIAFPSRLAGTRKSCACRQPRRA